MSVIAQTPFSLNNYSNHETRVTATPHKDATQGHVGANTHESRVSGATDK